MNRHERRAAPDMLKAFAKASGTSLESLQGFQKWWREKH
jgi:hypothetical protein